MKQYTNGELDVMTIEEIKDLMGEVLNEREQCKDPFSIEALRLDDFYSDLDGRLGQLEYESMVSFNKEFGEPVGEGENEFWRIVHECDDEENNPCEWATKLSPGNYIWIDKEENGLFGVHLVPDADIGPVKTFRSLNAAQEYVDKTYRNNARENEEQIFRKRGGR